MNCRHQHRLTRRRLRLGSRSPRTQVSVWPTRARGNLAPSFATWTLHEHAAPSRSARVAARLAGCGIRPLDCSPKAAEAVDQQVKIAIFFNGGSVAAQTPSFILRDIGLQLGA